jgi:glycosyltransferase involved in cell wall biosynthesis
MLLSGVYVLSHEPPVVAVADNFLEDAATIATACGVILHFLVFPTWYAGDLRGSIAATLKTRRVLPHSTTWMCNAYSEVNALRRIGNRAIFCHHNLFCNEQIFKPQEVENAFDAIYIARLDKYKRIWLASEVERLRLVTANPSDRSRLAKWRCDHAVLNDQFLDFDEIANEISKSRCGLALSKKEGGMFASTEYLLCGRPIISTRSRGGRDFWFDPYNHLIVEDNARSVAEAVKSVRSKPFNSEQIRRTTVEKQRELRRILFDYVATLSSKLLCSLEEMNGAWLRSQFADHKGLDKIFCSFAISQDQSQARLKARS